MHSYTQGIAVQKGQYHMTRYPGRPVPPERHPYLFAFSSLVRVVLWSLYIGYRTWCTQQAQYTEHVFLWRLWTVLYAEIFLSLEDILTALGIIYPLLTLENIPIPPRYRLTGSSAPTIDVCVTCCGEPADIIVNTLAAVAVQDYPSDRFRVILLDDGRDMRLKDAVEDLTRAKSTGPQILYRSRKLTLGMRSYYKAGNLRYGLHETAELGASEYFAVLDADMIPESDWLRKVVPHLILDDQVALACPPQVSTVRVPGKFRTFIQTTTLCFVQP